MSRRAVLWIAFAVVHLGVAWLGFLMPNEPMGDVYRVYDPWSLRALEGYGVVGITEPWVYPQLALIPMVVAQAFAWIAGYTIAWALVVIAADAAAFAILVGRAQSTGRVTAAWFWLSYIALLGPVGLYRLDGFTVPIAIVGCLWLIGRPWWASTLLAVATWMKVWPAALLAAAVVAVRRRGALLGGAVLVTAVTVGFVVLRGGAANVFGFIGDQTTRGLQVEAVISTPFLWGALLGWDGFWVFYDQDMLTFQVTGTNVDVFIAAMTPVLVIAMTALAALGAFAAWHGTRFVRLFPPLSLALVLGFIVFNKVGSPQYLCWLVPSIVFGLVVERHRWVAPASVALLAAVLTQLVYPVLYNGILYPSMLAIAVLTVRNLVLVAMLAWMVARLVAIVRHPAAVPLGAIQRQRLTV
ncbi:MAG: glycosyltransferase 87 family protein [Microbacterium sp.]